ncbi:MAG: 3-dehydroquinate synthase [Bacteroidetes bacterium]|nr:3-dehydroquinate synthase [Bacteroidota bacterium]
MFKKLSIENSSVVTGKGSLSELARFLEKKKYTKHFILCDENTSEHCLSKLITCSELLHDAHIIETESGESAKVMETCEQLWLTLQEHHADKNSVMINLGGGVITDMGGFVAALYKRGIPCINVPTTLLAMVDASVGGKNGIDFNGVKNLIGTIIQPELVIIDPVFLGSLSPRQIKNGMAEILKIAAVADAGFFKKIKPFKTPAQFIHEDIIFQSVKLKHAIVKKDPHEKHLRKCLNYGHSIGHALESACLLSGMDVLHGEAVAAGMLIETYIAWKSKATSKSTLNQVIQLVHRHFEKINITPAMEEQILDFIKHDKKNIQQAVVMAVVTDIGKFDLLKQVRSEIIREGIHFYSSQAR